MVDVQQNAYAKAFMEITLIFPIISPHEFDQILKSDQDILSWDQLAVRNLALLLGELYSCMDSQPQPILEGFLYLSSSFIKARTTGCLPFTDVAMICRRFESCLAWDCELSLAAVAFIYLVCEHPSQRNVRIVAPLQRHIRMPSNTFLLEQFGTTFPLFTLKYINWLFKLPGSFHQPHADDWKATLVVAIPSPKSPSGLPAASTSTSSMCAAPQQNGDSRVPEPKPEFNPTPGTEMSNQRHLKRKSKKIHNFQEIKRRTKTGCFTCRQRRMKWRGLFYKGHRWRAPGEHTAPHTFRQAANHQGNQPTSHIQPALTSQITHPVPNSLPLARATNSYNNQPSTLPSSASVSTASPSLPTNSHIHNQYPITSKSGSEYPSAIDLTLQTLLLEAQINMAKCFALSRSQPEFLIAIKEWLVLAQTLPAPHRARGLKSEVNFIMVLDKYHYASRNASQWLVFAQKALYFALFCSNSSDLEIDIKTLGYMVEQIAPVCSAPSMLPQVAIWPAADSQRETTDISTSLDDSGVFTNGQQDYSLVPGNFHIENGVVINSMGYPSFQGITPVSDGTNGEVGVDWVWI
ncbi:hypothetical protein BGZ63DRAFT_402019 [Mariannaea sp. PMI_226]|nr:hypothetical protein BGZ63DRAFT_402019 [Mariannaea sp. PMI_226]